MQFLVQNDPNNNLENAKENALIVASKKGHLNIVQFLVQNNADSLEDAIDVARENGHQHVIQFLITSLGLIDTTEDIDETDDTASS